MITVTVSQVLDYWRCPQYHWYRHVLKRGVTGEYKGAAKLGTLFHAKMEEFLKVLMATDMDPHQSVLDVWTKPGHWNLQAQLAAEHEANAQEAKPGDLLAADALSVRGAWWVAQEGWRKWETVLGAEEPFEYEVVPGVTMMGKPDGWIVWNGKLWHRQIKTHSGGLAALQLLVESSMHEATYAEAGPKLFPSREYGGTMLATFDKAALHLRKKGEKCTHCGKAGLVWKDPTEHVKTTFLSIDPGFITDMHQAVAVAAEGIQVQQEFYALRRLDPEMLSSAQWPRNLGSCADIFKKVLCGFREGVCQRRTTIDDQFAYVDIEPQGHYNIVGSEL